MKSELMKFLSINRSEAAKVEGTKEWSRVYDMKDPSVTAIQSGVENGPSD